jgi:hypothetical protein
MSASVYEIIKQPLANIREFLTKYSAELRETTWSDVYLIKCHSETKINESAINPLRGLLFNHRSGQIYSLTFPVPIEIKDLTPEDQKSLMTQITSKPYTVQEALDGTLLRLSYLEETHSWILSTNGKEDARQAYWMNGQSFHQQFWSANPPINLDHLDPHNIYLFILCHPLNVIVVNHTTPRIYHVTTYHKESLKEIDCDLHMERPLIFPSMTLEEVQKQVSDNHDKPVLSAGYMIVQMGDDGLVHRYRFENHNYTKARNLRGNSNNIEYRLLELMQGGLRPPSPPSLKEGGLKGGEDPLLKEGSLKGDEAPLLKEGGLKGDEVPLTEFLQYYPIYQSLVTRLTQRLELLARLLYHQYGLRYKQHIEIRVHPRHHRFLSEIHTQVYLAQLRNVGRTIQCSDILNFIWTRPTAYALYLLNYVYESN